jgi:plastocyanin
MTVSDKHWGRWAIALAGLALLSSMALRGGEAIGAGIGAQASAAKSVGIDHFAFHPPTLTIRKGGAVAFTNSSRVTHTASGGGFDTRRIKPGKTKLVRFAQRRTFAYHCRIHPFMKGRIVVE